MSTVVGGEFSFFSNFPCRHPTVHGSASLKVWGLCRNHLTTWAVLTSEAQKIAMDEISRFQWDDYKTIISHNKVPPWFLDDLHSGKLTWQWKMDQTWRCRDPLLKMGIFHCHVSLLKSVYRIVLQIYPSTCLVLVHLNSLCTLMIQMSIGNLQASFQAFPKGFHGMPLVCFEHCSLGTCRWESVARTAFHWHFVSMTDGACS